MSGPSGSSLDPWFRSREALAQDLVRELAEAGVLEPSRDSGSGRIRKWIKGWAPEIRQEICGILRDGRKREVSPVELAAMVSDLLRTLEHRVAVATLSIYIVRFAAEYVCGDNQAP
ncbi:MAG TPA: hypothetical protein VIH71_05045 [Solirubrobacteraceae bacterium]